MRQSGKDIWFNRVYGSHGRDLCLPRRSTEGHPSLSARPWERTFAPSAMYIQREFDAYLCPSGRFMSQMTLMDLLGLTVTQLLNTDKVRGVRLEGNDLLLDPALLLPPPHIAGRVTEVQVQGDHLLQVF